MRTLHLFGDSYTEGHLLDITLPSYKEWKAYRGGELPLCWGDLLSEKLNMIMCVQILGHPWSLTSPEPTMLGKLSKQ